MKIAQLHFRGNPNIGLFALANDGFCLTNVFISGKKAELMERVLKVPVYRTSVLGTGLVGIFAGGNSRGVIISDRIHADEIKRMGKDLNVLTLNTKHTAMGNLILSNDKGCVISEKLENHRERIGRFLGVKTEVGTVGGMELVGSLAACNSKGCVAYKGIGEKEKKTLEKTLGVPVHQGSVNFGNQWISSGVLANSNGMLMGKQTSGPEMGILSEAFGFV